MSDLKSADVPTASRSPASLSSVSLASVSTSTESLEASVASAARPALEVAERSRSLLARLPALGVDELAAEVATHDQAYWRDHAPQIDDATYDALVEALRLRAPDAPILQRVGGGEAAIVEPGGERRFGQVRHEQPMLSLDKCYDDETLEKWAEKIQGGFFVTPKIDGLACSLRYDGAGQLKLCATRGDGKVGDDITQNARQIGDIPAQVPAPPGVAFEVRGEVYLALSRFRAHYSGEFANPRNLAAGALKQKDPARSAEYGLSFFAYDVLGLPLASEQEKRAFLARQGFSVPEGHYAEGAEALAAHYRALLEKRAAFDYETDGVVMKADRVSEHERLGLTAHHPRYALAYKFQGDAALTTLVDVEWSVGRSGVITPVAVVEPVFVSGVTVTRASLHHAGYIGKLGLRHQARVELVRRGGVIPHVERVIEAEGSELPRPTCCPSCAGPVRDEGDFVYCAGPDVCPDVVRARVFHFTSVIDVLGFGKKHLAQLIERGLVRGAADLFRLTQDQLTGLERMGPTLAEKLISELRARQRLPLATFLTALGIEEVGPTVAETLCAAYPTLPALRAASAEDLAALHGVGPAIAGALVAGLQARAAEIDDLLGLLTLEAPVRAAPSDHPLSGRSVVFTGKLARLDRKNAQRQVREVGGKTPAGVTADLDFLVIGDEGSPLLGEGTKSTKQVAAEKWIAKGAGIRIVSEGDFVQLLEERPTRDPPG